MKDNIIKFNAKKIEVNDQSEYDDFEDWESDAEFFYKQDWDGLEKYRYSKVLKNPNDVYNQWMLGDAYVLAKKYDEAINILAKLHKQDPEDPNIQISLLDALFASGKDESDMDWVIKPSVLRLNSYTLDCCYDFMKGKRKPKTVYELHLNLYSIGYPAFDNNQLMIFLSTDKRFQLSNIEDQAYNCFVSIRKKK